MQTKLLGGTATIRTGADDVVRIADRRRLYSVGISVYTRVFFFRVHIFLLYTRIMDIARLTTIVQEYEELYDFEHPNYSNRQRRDHT